MKKYCLFFLLFLLPTFSFAKGNNIYGDKDIYVDANIIFSSGATIESNKLLSDYTPQFTLSADIHTDAHILRNDLRVFGITFFWNNTFSIANKESTWQKKSVNGSFSNATGRTMFLSSEILLGKTFKKTRALYISFGFGLRGTVCFNPEGFFLPGFGGTVGLSYYFKDDWIGISAFASDFFYFGSSLGKIKSYDVGNTFTIKLGVNMRSRKYF